MFPTNTIGSEISKKTGCASFEIRLNAPHQTPAERCRSGRTGRSRKPLSLYGFPGFESLSLRHSSKIAYFVYMLPIWRIKEPKLEPKYWLLSDRFTHYISTDAPSFVGHQEGQMVCFSNSTKNFTGSICLQTNKTFNGNQ